MGCHGDGGAWCGQLKDFAGRKIYVAKNFGGKKDMWRK